MDPENYKIDSGILPEDKDNLTAELAHIKKLLDDIEQGDPDVSYADTGDSMEILDGTLGRFPWYQDFLAQRREISKRKIGGDKSVIREVRSWLEGVKNKL